MELSEIRDELECTICLDLSASPIYTCKNGHVICGICFDKKIEKCPSCQASPLEICPFAERLSRKVTKFTLLMFLHARFNFGSL